MIVLAQCDAFRIGTVEVRPAILEVVGARDRKTVEPRVMQVLVALAEADGEVVSRDELIRRCWDGRVVGENAINRVITILRKLCETIADGSVGITTINKVGYRLVVEQDLPAVAPPEARSDDPGLADDPQPPAEVDVAKTADPSSASRFSRRGLIGGGAALAAVAATGSWALWLRAPSGPPPEALQAFANGRNVMRSGRGDAYPEAIAQFTRATELSPDYADAWGYLAIALEFARLWQPLADGDPLEVRALAATERALAIDPNNGPALASRVLPIPVYGDWLTAEHAARDVIARAPGAPIARGILSRVLEEVGRIGESLSAVSPYDDEESMEPFCQFRVAVLLHNLGRNAESDQVIGRAMRLWPQNISIWFTRFYLYARYGRSEAALAMLGEGRQRPLGIEDWNFQLVESGARAARTGAAADVNAAVDAHMASARRGAGFAENAMILTAQFGRLDEAFAVADAYYFGRGFSVGTTRYGPNQGASQSRIRLMTRHFWYPVCAPMRRDPRFAALLDEMGMPSYWRRSGSRPDRLA